MAYVVPTPADLVLRFPEFDPVDVGRIQIFLDDAILEVGESWLESDRARAQILLACHRLALAGEPARSISGSSGAVAAATAGDVESITVGRVTVDFASRSAAAGGNISAADPVLREYLRTTYGVQYWEILTKNFYPVMAI